MSRGRVGSKGAKQDDDDEDDDGDDVHDDDDDVAEVGQDRCTGAPSSSTSPAVLVLAFSAPVRAPRRRLRRGGALRSSCLRSRRSRSRRGACTPARRGLLAAQLPLAWCPALPLACPHASPAQTRRRPGPMLLLLAYAQTSSFAPWPMLLCLEFLSATSRPPTNGEIGCSRPRSPVWAAGEMLGGSRPRSPGDEWRGDE